VLIRKVTPNNLIYLVVYFSDFSEASSYFLDLIPFLCYWKKIKEIFEIFSISYRAGLVTHLLACLCGPPSQRPTPIMQPTRPLSFPNPPRLALFHRPDVPSDSRPHRFPTALATLAHWLPPWRLTARLLRQVSHSPRASLPSTAYHLSAPHCPIGLRRGVPPTAAWTTSMRTRTCPRPAPPLRLPDRARQSPLATPGMLHRR
jgi:hypothetical protein